MPKSIQELVTEAKSQIENLDVEQTAAEIEQGALVVDIRESEELAQHGRIPGAMHIPRGLLEFQAGQLDSSQRIVLSCAAGGRSALAVLALKELGYENVAHLDGGFTAWKEAGKPVE